MMRRLLLLTVLGTAPLVLWGQEGDLWAFLMRDTPHDRMLRAQVDTNFLREEGHRLHMRLYSATRTTSFVLTPTEGGYPSATFEPNQPPSLGVAVHWGRVGLGLSIQNPLAPRQNDTKGDTRTFTLVAQLLGRRSITEVFLQRTQGFFLSNPADVFGSFAGPVYPQRPDLRVWHGHINYLINLNWRRFSYRAAYVQTEVQKRSAGGLLVMPTVNYTHIRADTTILPNLRSDAPASLRLRDGMYISAGGLGGYGHTFVWRRLYGHASALVGANLGWFQKGAELESGYHTKWGLVPRANLRLAVGYNAPHWFAVINYTGDFFTLRYQALQYGASTNAGNVAIGYRLGGY